MKCKHNIPAELCPDCLRVEIERLKADNVGLRSVIEANPEGRFDTSGEIERLRAALNNIVTRYDTKQDGWHAEDMKEIARRALEGK